MKTYTDLSQTLNEQDKVEFLDLSNQGLTEIPVEIGQLTNLTRLHLTNNQIRGLPTEVIQLTHLTELYLWKNEISLIPPELCQLTNLTQLNLDRNLNVDVLHCIYSVGILRHITSLLNSQMYGWTYKI